MYLGKSIILYVLIEQSELFQCTTQEQVIFEYHQQGSPRKTDILEELLGLDAH